MDNRLDTSFWLEDSDGKLYFPARILNRQTGRATFRVSNKGNLAASAIELTDVDAVADHVVRRGYSVRAVEQGKRSPANLLGLGKRKIVNWGRR